MSEASDAERLAKEMFFEYARANMRLEPSWEEAPETERYRYLLSASRILAAARAKPMRTT